MKHFDYQIVNIFTNCAFHYPERPCSQDQQKIKLSEWFDYLLGKYEKYKLNLVGVAADRSGPRCSFILHAH